jgi:hypothetical protein
MNNDKIYYKYKAEATSVRKKGELVYYDPHKKSWCIVSLCVEDRLEEL